MRNIYIFNNIYLTVTTNNEWFVVNEKTQYKTKKGECKKWLMKKIMV